MNCTHTYCQFSPAKNPKGTNETVKEKRRKRRIRSTASSRPLSRKAKKHNKFQLNQSVPLSFHLLLLLLLGHPVQKRKEKCYNYGTGTILIHAFTTAPNPRSSYFFVLIHSSPVSLFFFLFLFFFVVILLSIGSAVSLCSSRATTFTSYSSSISYCLLPPPPARPRRTSRHHSSPPPSPPAT